MVVTDQCLIHISIFFFPEENMEILQSLNFLLMCLFMRCYQPKGQPLLRLKKVHVITKSNHISLLNQPLEAEEAAA